MADLQGWVLPPKFLNTCRSCVCENTWSQTPVSHAKFSLQCFWLAFLNTSASAITGWSVYVFRLLDGWFLQWLFNEQSVLNIWVLGCVGCVGSLWFNSWHSWGFSSKTCMSRSHFEASPAISLEFKVSVIYVILLKCSGKRQQRQVYPGPLERRVKGVLLPPGQWAPAMS